jgi:hypothetical protein
MNIAEVSALCSRVQNDLSADRKIDENYSPERSYFSNDIDFIKRISK